ncbi:collagen alpha-2(I) chain-like isoform X1 [Amphibalanus amphitrite]|uniref:collagen alpha-2(I) chain-like isoform X1 n=1 Tax=Amphibalanus amphitrite TaxID=1232801 RepID=UPI001C922705|nr:collagen alpha-2(I) chain-like isoform X1 [Amphibalanus amphitrite]XP_043233569.1 collagen alpha-2(I) chain-like isoform X1 [Amphibalanus amphitrite]
MKPAAFRTLLVLALLALAVGQKNKSSRRKSKRKSTTTEAAPETTTTAAPTTTLPPPPPPPQQPARAPTQWYNGRGGPGSGPGFSGPGRFSGAGPSGGSGAYRNVGRHSGSGGFTSPSAFGGRPAYQGRNNYQVQGAAQAAGYSQGAGGFQGSGSSQGPSGGQASAGPQGAVGAQGAGSTQGPSNTRGVTSQVRGRPGRPYYYLSWRDAPPTRMLYTWAEADDICRMEGGQLISVNTREKQSYLSWLFDEEAEDIRSLWTSGKFQTGEFRWADGTAVSAGYTRWSRTGPLFQPQPDNAEGFEDCIAVLNDLYGDGVAWHDEQCSYRHHFVCEL